MHIMVAEDDPRLARLLERGLARQGHEIEVVYTGIAALALAASTSFDLLLLDVLLPGLDGFTIVRSLRERAIVTPILILTARTDIDDRVEGLEAGADDYLIKPFAFEELLARINAVARRSRPAATLRVVELGPTEFRLLEYLMRHAGQILTREDILMNVWGYDADPGTNVVDLYVHYLRRKLGPDAPIVTVRGFGYRLVED